MTNQAHSHDGADTQHEAHHGPSAREYLRIGFILLIVTILEVFASFLHSYLGVPMWLQITVLIALAILKGAMVLMFFMHLRFDSRWFTFLMTTGLILATFGIIIFEILFRYRAGQVD